MMKKNGAKSGHRQGQTARHMEWVKMERNAHDGTGVKHGNILAFPEIETGKHGKGTKSSSWK